MTSDICERYGISDGYMVHVLYFWQCSHRHPATVLPFFRTSVRKLVIQQSNGLWYGVALPATRRSETQFCLKSITTVGTSSIRKSPHHNKPRICGGLGRVYRKFVMSSLVDVFHVYAFPKYLHNKTPRFSRKAFTKSCFYVSGLATTT